MRVRYLNFSHVVIFFLLSVALLSYMPSIIYGSQYDDEYSEDENYDYIEESEYTEEPEYIEDERGSIIEKALNDIEIEFAVDYQRVNGEQLFTVVDSGGERISQLTYPIKGDMHILRGEARLNPRLSLGIKYGSSNFSDTTSSDEDWNFTAVHNSETKTITYQITEQDTESEMETFDINLYWRLLDIKDDPDEKNVNNFLVTDRISLDVFGGYHQQKGRYTMKDPTTQYLRIVDDVLWQATGLPLYQGLYSSYKVKYSGPKLGLRCRGEKGRFSTGLSAAYACIKTTAHGWWNLRSYSFTQKSTQLGRAIMLDANMRYNFYNDWYAGIGYNYMEYVQEKLKESGVQPGSTYDDLDIIRDVNNKVYGPYFTLGVIW